MTASAPTKVTRPQPARAITRARLYHHLDRSRNQPVVWVTGPPGAGKTTLVSTYLDAHHHNGIWYQVDAGDADPATIFHYIEIAARHADPDHHTPLPVFTPEHHPGLGLFARRYFEALFSQWKAPATLVLDDYHEVAADSVFHTIVAEAVAVLPKGIRLIVISRTGPPAAFARLRANDMLAVVEYAEFKLTLDESQAIAQLRGRHNLDLLTLEHLHKRVDGWTAGLILLLELPDVTSVAQSVPGGDGYQVLFDYFATEIFQKFDATTQTILCQAALLPQASADTIRALSGKPEAGDILADLYRRNYFVTKQGRGEDYQFHPLFHDFLLHRAHAAFPADQLNALRAQAATLLEAAGDIDAAAELWRAASDWGALQAHILKHASAFVAQARFTTLENWLRALPAIAFEQMPWLHYWLGICRMQFDPTEASEHFERAYAAFSGSDDAAGLYGSWSGVIQCLYLLWQDFTLAGRWLDALEDLRRRHPQWPSPEIEARVVTAAVIGYSGHRPDHPNLRQWLAHAMQLIDTNSDDVQRIQLATHTTNALYWLGENRQAKLLVESLDQVGKSIDDPPITKLWWDCILMTYNWHKLSPHTAITLLDQALLSVQATGLQTMDHYPYAQAVYAALTAGDLTAAKKFLEAMSESLPRHSSLPIAHYIGLNGYYDIHVGQYNSAIEHARRALTMGQVAAMPYGIAKCHLILATALHGNGEHEAARQHLDAMRSIGASMASRQIEYWCNSLEAHIAFEDGNTKSGLDSLTRAMALSREMDGMPMYWWPREQVAQLYANALEHDIETDHVCDLIRRLGLAPADPATAPESWPWPLKLYTLGRYSIVLNGKPLRFQGKAQRKPLELLMVLVSLGGREVSEARISEVLWENAEADAAHTTFGMTLHRLRKLLGDDSVVILSDNRLSLNPARCWVDTWAFERVVAQAKSGSPSERDVQRVLGYYQGSFLSHAAHDAWTLAYREKLRAKFLRFATHTSLSCLKQGRYDEAMHLIDKGLEAEPLAEELYRNRMRCQAALGQRAEALATYRRCQTMLSTLLGIEPAVETQALYQALSDNLPLP